MFFELDSSTEKLLKEMKENEDNLFAFLKDKFEQVENSFKDDAKLRSQFKILIDNNYFSCIWADNIPFSPYITHQGESYLEFKKTKTQDIQINDFVPKIIEEIQKEFDIANFMPFYIRNAGSSLIAWQQADDEIFEVRIEVTAEKYKFEQAIKALSSKIEKSNYVLTKRKNEDRNVRNVATLTYVSKRKVDVFENHNKRSYYSFEKLLNDIIKACLQLQGNRIYKNALENERNTFIASLLEAKGYFTKDQTLWGESIKGKASGEIDIFIRQNDGEPFSIIEALNLDSLRRDYIDLHLKKIFGYDPNGLKHNVILVYSTAKNFTQLWEKYIEYLPIFEYPYAFVEFNENKSYDYSEIRVGQSIHLRNEKRIFLNHILLNLV